MGSFEQASTRASRRVRFIFMKSETEPGLNMHFSSSVELNALRTRANNRSRRKVWYSVIAGEKGTMLEGMLLISVKVILINDQF